MLKPSATFVLRQAFIILVSFTIIQVTLACKCTKPTASRALNSPTSSIFTGTVIRRKKPLDTNMQETAAIVSIDRIIKGCTLDLSDRIIVTTASSSAACGVNLIVNETYFFTGVTEKLDTDLLLTTYGLTFETNPISSKVHASACSFNTKRSNVAMRDRNMLFTYGRTKNICPTACIVGSTCPIDSYCDSGKCKLFYETCPLNRPPTPCVADPCTTIEPCQNNLRCTPSYCGTCTAIFTDANRTRVCEA